MDVADTVARLGRKQAPTRWFGSGEGR
jgi:hypothetical protein